MEKNLDQISIVWCTEDVLHTAEEMNIELTTDQAREILGLLDRNHDANIGISWDVISSMIDIYLREYNQ
jgi:hypothetical protein